MLNHVIPINNIKNTIDCSVKPNLHFNVTLLLLLIISIIRGVCPLEVTKSPVYQR